MMNQKRWPQCMSFAGMPKQNLQTIDISSKCLRSHLTAYSLMGFADSVSLAAPQNYEKIHSMEQNGKNVENTWESPRSLTF